MNIGGILWVNTSNKFFQSRLPATSSLEFLEPMAQLRRRLRKARKHVTKQNTDRPTAQPLHNSTGMMVIYGSVPPGERYVRQWWSNMMACCRWSVNSRNGSKSSWRMYLASVLSWCLWCTSCGRKSLSMSSVTRVTLMRMRCECLWRRWHHWGLYLGFCFIFFSDGHLSTWRKFI